MSQENVARARLGFEAVNAGARDFSRAMECVARASKP